MNNQVGRKLRHIRQIRKLSMADLEKISGVRSSVISDIENGNSTDPRISTLIRLAKALNVDIHYFLDDDLQSPLQLNIELPQDIVEFISKEESLPYIRLGKEVREKGLDPESISFVIEAFRREMELSIQRIYDKE